MGWFGKFFRKRKEVHYRNKGIGYEREHNYAEAAKAYAEEAGTALNDNELIFADDCLDAASNWLKAGNIEEALNQARRALQGFMLDDWLREDADDDGEYLKELTDMVGDMRRAGHPAEADAFLSDINKALVSLGLKPVTLLVMTTENKFPADCPHCGAAVTYKGNLDSIDCPFCGGTIDAVTNA